MSNQRPVRADVQALSGLLRQFDNQLKEQGRSEERSIVLDALQKLEASPVSLQQSSSNAANQQRLSKVSMQQSKASAA
ncbi:MAG: hypothetical protein NTW74_19180 [Acidobacteria bacterium]|nr:hypothetical protein [Acidobacteriota bacterium]